MEDIEKKIKNTLAEQIELPIKYKNIVRNTLNNEKIEWRGYNLKKKLIATICTGITLMSGVAFATNFDKIINSFNLGKGIDTAVENGYIAETDMEYLNSNSNVTDGNNEVILNDINVEAKISDFIMDDLNISTHFEIKLDSKINETIDLDNIDNIMFKDLNITDEENRILFSTNDEETYFNCGINSFIDSHNKENGIINFTYNIYTDNDNFPKSKKLNYKFTTIELQTGENKILLIGNWNIDVDVPEEMYNRTKEYYKVISCDNEYMNIYTTTLSETGFEIGMTINNIKKPEEGYFNQNWKTLVVTENNTEPKENATYMNMDEFEKWFDTLRPIRLLPYNNKENEMDGVSYISNENGEKFYASTSPSRRHNCNYIDGDKYNFYETFELTKYDASNKLKLVLYYWGNPVTIELEKIDR